tara:strand:+ start:965 stop:1453 length:489 start_codon:yes stop_codon:yes gene_type:complete
MSHISIIVAKSSNNVIGNEGNLPWHIPEDLKNFKSLTMGKPMIMGRSTFESIGKALPGRKNIVMTRDKKYQANDISVAHTLEEALIMCDGAREIMIIGGGEIYKLFFGMVNRIYLTNVEKHIDGDVFFPDIDLSKWKMIRKEEYPLNTERKIGFNLEILERI